MIGSTFSTPIYKQFAETGDSGLFEHVIDDVILEKYSDDDNIKNFIKDLPSVDKRMSTLSLMSDDNVLWKKIYEIHRGNDTKYNKIKKIILLLRDYVKIADVERKSHGEILTPFNELAKPMVNLMDKYDEEFWTIPTNKVLDSSAGYGTFLILCLYKFMEGLKDFEPNEDLRLKHIIENQLYYGELQSKSVFSWLVAIDPNDEYDTNIYWGSYLEEGFDYHMKNVWNVEKFDLIIQNPPYQKTIEGNNINKPIWHFFVNKSIELLVENGYMIMVHPSGWRSIKTFKNTKDILLSKDIKFIKMHSFNDGQKIFDAAINFDYYILKNTKYNNTDIICEDNSEYNLDISNLEIIPSENILEIISLFAKENEDKVNILSNSSYHHSREYMSRDKSIVNLYPCVYTVRSNNEPTFKWSSINDRGHFDIPKVIFGNGASGVIIDYSGAYAMTQFAYAIIDDIDNLNDIKNVLTSKYFIKNIMLFKNSLGDKYNRKLISQFRRDFWKEFINK